MADPEAPGAFPDPEVASLMAVMRDLAVAELLEDGEVQPFLLTLEGMVSILPHSVTLRERFRAYLATAAPTVQIYAATYEARLRTEDGPQLIVVIEGGRRGAATGYAQAQPYQLDAQAGIATLDGPIMDLGPAPLLFSADPPEGTGA
jgi:hypothetical protein